MNSPAVVTIETDRQEYKDGSISYSEENWYTLERNDGCKAQTESKEIVAVHNELAGLGWQKL